MCSLSVCTSTQGTVSYSRWNSSYQDVAAVGGGSLLGPQVFLSTEARTLAVWRSALPLQHTQAQLRDTPCPPNPGVALCSELWLDCAPSL